MSVENLYSGNAHLNTFCDRLDEAIDSVAGQPITILEIVGALELKKLELLEILNPMTE